MAKLVDPRNLPSQKATIPGLKPPVSDFTPTDDADPVQVDAFNQMIRDLRDQGPAPHPPDNERTPSRH
jgi:hypothetical protein